MICFVEQGGATVLHAAASVGHVGIMGILMDKGLSPKDTDKEGDTPLHWIPGNGTAASVRILLDRGADINAQNKVFVHLLHYITYCWVFFLIFYLFLY